MKLSTTQRITALGIAAAAVIAVHGTASSSSGNDATTCRTWHPQGIVDVPYQHTWNPDDATGAYQHIWNPDDATGAYQHTWNPDDATGAYQHTWNPDDAVDGRYQHKWNPAGDRSTPAC